MNLLRSKRNKRSLPVVLEFSGVAMLARSSSSARAAALIARPPPIANQTWLTRTLVLIVALTVLMTTEMFLFDGRLLTRLTHEDGVFENVEAINYFATCLLLLYVVVAERVTNIWLVGLSLLFFVAGGEEISWGQRIFSVATPESLRAINVQGETNLHNIEGVNGSVRAFSLLALWGIFVVIPVATLFEPTDKVIRRLRLPVANWGATLAIVASTAIMSLARLLGQDIFQLDEVGEFLTSFAALSLGVGMWAAARSQRWHSPIFEGYRPVR